jgi:hypothetical protein
MRKPIPGEEHHWFPKALAQAWTGDDGRVARTNVRGHTRRLFPKGLGYKPDHHNVLFDGGSPWDTTFEPDFDAADNAFPAVIRWLEAVGAAHELGERALPVAIDESLRGDLAECLASLIVRSPRMRFLSESSIEHYQTKIFGAPGAHNVHQTAGSNLQRLQTPFARAIRTGGKFAFLLAGEESFLFGDGFMHNLNSVPDIPILPMAMVAFTPKVAALWFCPTSYPSFPKGVSLTLSPEEVGDFNDIIQIYARNDLFHIGDTPKLHPAFEAGQHMAAHHNGVFHRAPIVESWKAEALDLWEDG